MLHKIDLTHIPITYSADDWDELFTMSSFLLIVTISYYNEADTVNRERTIAQKHTE